MKKVKLYKDFNEAIDLDGVFMKGRTKSRYKYVELVHVYKNGKLWGTGELVPGKEKGNKVLVRLDGSDERWFPKKDVKLVESKINSKRLNEISTKSGLNDVIKGRTSAIEGIKISKELAEALLYWIQTSPYGRKYGKNILKGRIASLIGPANAMGFGDRQSGKLKAEWKEIVKKHGPKKESNLTESRKLTKWDWTGTVTGKRRTLYIFQVGDDMLYVPVTDEEMEDYLKGGTLKKKLIKNLAKSGKALTTKEWKQKNPSTGLNKYLDPRWVEYGDHNIVEQKLNEISDNNWSYKEYTSRLNNQAKVKKALKSAGFGNLDTKGAEKQLKKMEDTGLPMMFAHLAYYYIIGRDGKTYFIHETQFWVSDYYDRWTNGEDVNVSRIAVDLVENYAPAKWRGDTAEGEKTHIGVALVPKKDFLAGLRNMEQLENSNRI